MRKTVFIFLESRLGPIDTNNGQISDDDQKLTHTEKVNGGGKGGGRVSIGSKGDQKRFLLTDMQLEVLSSTEFMKQIVQDFTHFGTLNVHEDELVLESYKRSRTIAACQKLERRLGTLWTVEEVVQCMRDMGCSEDDCESRAEQLKFLCSMVQKVNSGARFRKHRKHGKTAHRWILIDKDRVYWKENAAAQNQRTRSFHLAKIVAIQPGKHTPALKNADNVDDRNCFSIVSKKHITLDLSGEDDNTVNEWIVFLRAYNGHYKSNFVMATMETENRNSYDKIVKSPFVQNRKKHITLVSNSVPKNVNTKKETDKIKTFADFFNIFELTDEYKQKFIQQGFANIVSLEYIDEYVLYE
eukprot:45541_1